MQQRGENACATRSDRMTKGHRATMNVDTIWVQAEVFDGCHRHDRKRFIDLVEVDLIRIELQFPEKDLNRFDRRYGKPFGGQSLLAVPKDPRHGRDVES